MSLNLYGLLIALAIAVAAWLLTREEKRLGLPKDTGLDILLYAVPPAVLMARLYYVAFTWDVFRDDLLSILYFWEGGLAIYGGVIGGALGVWFLCRRRKLSFAMAADMVAPSLLLGQAIGRWGNYFNGEAFGYAVTDVAWQFFPFAVQVAGGWHLATFFYESMWNLLGFVFLYTNRVRFQEDRRYGRVFLWYLLWYGIGRLCIEGLRKDSLMWGPIRVSQLLSLLLAAGALAALILRGRRPALVVMPAAALALPFLFPGWTGILAAAAVLLIGAILVYFRHSKASTA